MVRDLNFVSVFQYSSAFLSRKRVQNYCFTAYTPNFRNTFLLKICIFLLNLLIFKRCRTTSNGREVCLFDTSIPYYLSRERKGGVLSPSQRGGYIKHHKKGKPWRRRDTTAPSASSPPAESH